MAYENILVEKRGHVGLITLNRPKALNALSAELVEDLNSALDDFDSNEKIAAVVITGSSKAFAAGADITQMADLDFVAAFTTDFIGEWDKIADRRKPLIAAVSGYALGGGCELALMCDIVLASETARFGLPEITIGVMPGSGGTQRLTRAIGKAKAMEMVLTGRQLDADEAERSGLISRIVPGDDLIDEAIKVGQRIAELSLPAIMMAKESVNRAFETSLTEGLRFERRVFHSLFATEDQKEGMAAFLEKRQPQFKNR